MARSTDFPLNDPPRPPGLNAQRLRARGRPSVSRSRRPIGPGLVGAALGLVVLLVLGAYLYDHSRRDLIAPGVRVAGVDIGGLRLSAARERLRRQLALPLERPLVVRVGHRRFTISARQAHVAVAVDALASQALADSRRGWILGRVLDGLDGHRLNVNIPPQVTYSAHAIHRLVRRIALRTQRPARDASVAPSRYGLHEVASHPGQAVVTAGLATRIEHTLQQPSPRRVVSAPVHAVAPKVTLANLASHYPAYIVIDRADFKLRFFKHLRLSHTYTIAVGRQGLETPAGLYDIQWKEVNPSWHVPNSPWAGSLAGQTIPPGPQDPIKARWMAFNGGAGIHGTDETSSLGTAASHGCIRMSIPDVIQLYPQVPVHTPVFVA